MEAVNLIQGSPEWLEFRKNHYPASEAPSMMGTGKFVPKTPEDLALVRMGLKEMEISEYQQKIFDDGHETEENARPLAEMIIGESLANMTCRKDFSELALGLSASLDGVNFGGDIVFEHKIWNASIAESIKKGQLSPYYTWQLEQQLLVSGAKKALFVTSDSFKISLEDFESRKDSLAMYSDVQTEPDGTEFRYAANDFAYIEYEAQPGKAEELIQGWMRFEEIMAEVFAEDESWVEIAENFLHINQEIKTLNAKKKDLENRLKPYKTSLIDTVKSSGTTKMIGAGVEVVQMVRKGGIDEKLLEQFLTPEQIEQCRKSESVSWQVKESKIKPTSEQIAKANEVKKKSGDKPSISISAIPPSPNVANAGNFAF
ncbi:hypothetical protein JCM30760_26660 [Thiomicrorhabdus hydrogeniphila]